MDYGVNFQNIYVSKTYQTKYERVKNKNSLNLCLVTLVCDGLDRSNCQTFSKRSSFLLLTVSATKIYSLCLLKKQLFVTGTRPTCREFYMWQPVSVINTSSYVNFYEFIPRYYILFVLDTYYLPYIWHYNYITYTNIHFFVIIYIYIYIYICLVLFVLLCIFISL